MPRDNDKERQRRAKLKREGKCMYCGKPKESLDFVLCTSCRVLSRDRMRLRNARLKAEGRPQKNGGKSKKREFGVSIDIYKSVEAIRGDKSDEAVGLLPRLTIGRPLGVELVGEEAERYRELAQKAGVL